MKTSVCHYSFHRVWKANNWTCEQLAGEVKALGCEGIDFHAGLLGSSVGAVEKIMSAVRRTGLTLSGLSLSNNFNQEDPIVFEQQIDVVKEWLRVASEVQAPVSRIFGGALKLRNNQEAYKKGFKRIIQALEQVVKDAEKLGVILALENHGGLPCTGEEQVRVIEAIHSPYLRATIDVGNYLQGGQEGHVGTALAAPYAAYVHFKDFQKTTAKDSSAPWGLKACVLGRGDVDHLQCLKVLHQTGYRGFIALEYEASDDEKQGVSQSLTYLNRLMKQL